ncbi:metalloprotease [Coemansia guatemalensis]|uniref:Metalloprotease n=1 Tax=Coemansia guatemalensis TaxID=2761395 RepID=A0A9W8I3M4_9FUNG|nr:metalloprotease [Coemansia guatemalensis]
MCTSGDHALVADFPSPEPVDWVSSFDTRYTDNTQQRYYRYTGTLVLPADDLRQYSLLRLTNNMRVLCVSDPTVKQSAASLAVNIGSCADPPELQGLAHALEHLLFMGTAKYPSEKDFEAYLTCHSGHTNATTSSLMTHYRFAVNNKGLVGALDRFAQFFIAPLLSADCVSRELRAVESEFRSNVQNDSKRRARISQTTCCSYHPYSRFHGGNNASLQEAASCLGLSLRDEMAGFFDKYYSADLMNLVIVGGTQDGADLEQLVEWSVDMFSQVPSRGDTRPDYLGHPLCDQKLGNIVRYQTIGDRYTISMSFALPQINHLYSSNPLRYVESLLNHGGSGSLIACLKRQRWATTMTTDNSAWNSDRSCIFNIMIHATPDGFAHYKDIVALVFAYLRIAQQGGIHQWYFEEIQKLAHIQFFYGEPAYALTAAVNLSRQMCSNYLRPEHAVSGSQLLYDYDAKAIETVLSFFNPNRYRLMLGARSFPGIGRLSNVEAYFEIPYSEETLPHDMAAGMQLYLAPSDLTSCLQFPRSNKFLPDNIELDVTPSANSAIKLAAVAPMSATSVHAEKEDLRSAPNLLLHNDMYELWTKRFSRGKLGRASIEMYIESTCFGTSPRAQLYTDLLRLSLTDSISEELAMATQAGFKHGIWTSDHRFCIRVSGHQGKLPLLLYSIVRGLRTLVVDQNKFDHYLNRIRRSLVTIGLEPPNMQALLQHYYLKAVPRWHYLDWKQELDNVTHEGLQSFVAKLFARLRVAMLTVGTFTDTEAIGITQRVLAMLNPQAAIPVTFRSHLYALDIVPNTYLQRLVLANDVNTDNAVNYAIYAGKDVHSIDSYNSRCRDRAILILIAHVMSIPFFDQLRTQEQLGYMVRCSWQATVDSYSSLSRKAGILTFAVQGSCNPEYVCLRIEAFLLQFRTRLAGMSKEELDANISACVIANQELPMKVASVAKQAWQMILDNSYDFDHVRNTNLQLERLTMDDVLEFWDAFISPTSTPAQATRVVVQVWSSSLARIAPSMATPDVMADYPLPVIAIHLCLVQIGIGFIELADVDKIVSCSRKSASASSSTADVYQCQQQLCTLYRVRAIENSLDIKEIERVCNQLIDKGSHVHTALRMALEADSTTSSLLTCRKAEPLAGPSFASMDMRRTYSGAWAFDSHHSFKRVQGLCAPVTPVRSLTPKYVSMPTPKI